MGVASSVVRRTVQAPLQAQRKVEKVLNDKPKPAPRHQTTEDLFRQAQQENQEKFESYNKKSDEYLQLLKNIHVDSTDVEGKNVSASDDKTLSSTISTRSLTSEQLTLLFQQQMANSDEWNEEKIANYFELPSKSVKNLLKYYSDFNVQVAPKIPEPLDEMTY